MVRVRLLRISVITLLTIPIDRIARYYATVGHPVHLDVRLATPESTVYRNNQSME